MTQAEGKQVHSPWDGTELGMVRLKNIERASVPGAKWMQEKLVTDKLG